jgi:hypothetical protein
MILRLALAELRHRPGRALFLLGGYALGVAVMVVLLAVGEAMLEQARDRALVGGGDVVLVPAGVSTEMLKAGGVSSLFLGVDHARFIQREILESERGREEFGIRGGSPVLDGKQVELRARGRVWKAVASGEVPSRARLAGAAPALTAGRWADSEADRRWTAPTRPELFREIDRFHLPTGAAARDSTWAEWHYFNVVLDADRWVYVTLMVAGRMDTPGKWGGRVLLTVRERDGRHRSLDRILRQGVRFDTASPDLRFAEDAFVRLEGDDYRVVAAAGDARVDLLVRPAPRRYFPPTDLGGEGLVSGYTVPALFARATGTVCTPRCEPVSGAQAYHDHNWGTWRGVTWEWGSASDSALSLLYGVVRGDSTGTEGLFAYLVDGRGARGVFRPGPLRYTAMQTVAAEDGRAVSVPRAMEFEDPRRGLRVRIDVRAAHVTDTGADSARRWFVQMRGVATVEERGRVVGRLPGFFETYVE